MQRHDLVYVHPQAGWQSACAPPSAALALVVADWIASGRPLVAARQDGNDGTVLLGLTLPLAQGRQRLAIRVAANAVVRCRPALTVGECLGRLPDQAAVVLGELSERAQACAARLGVYGSLAWETVSGEPYRHAASDIDLVCDVTTAAQLLTMLHALEVADARLSARLDGEIRFPDGNAVAWREVVAAWGTPQTQVLAKGQHTVALLPLAQLMAALSPEPADA